MIVDKGRDRDRDKTQTRKSPVRKPVYMSMVEGCVCACVCLSSYLKACKRFQDHRVAVNAHTGKFIPVNVTGNISIHNSTTTYVFI